MIAAGHADSDIDRARAFTDVQKSPPVNRANVGHPRPDPIARNTLADERDVLAEAKYGEQPAPQTWEAGQEFEHEQTFVRKSIGPDVVDKFRRGSVIPGQNLRALVHGKGKRCAGWIAKLLTPTSRDAHEPFGRTRAESRPIPRVLARRSQFAFLLTAPDLVPALERNGPRYLVPAVLGPNTAASELSRRGLQVVQTAP